MMRFILNISLLLITATGLKAQWSFTPSYAYLNAKQWDEAIRQYNFARPWQENDLHFLTSGYALQTGWQSRISAMKSLFFHTQAGYAHFSTQVKNNGDLFKFQLHQLFIKAELHVSPKGLIRNVSAGPLGTRWFIFFGPNLNYWMARASFKGEDYSTPQNAPYKPKNLAFSVSFGTGFHALMLKNKIAVTPKFGVRWFPKTTVDQLPEAIQGANVTHLKAQAANVWMYETSLEFTWLFARKKSGKGLVKPCASC